MMAVKVRSSSRSVWSNANVGFPAGPEGGGEQVRLRRHRPADFAGSLNDSHIPLACIHSHCDATQARHYVEKPEEFLSDTVNAGLYLFDSNLLFTSIRDAMDTKLKRSS